jgi:hypothetical protein
MFSEMMYQMFLCCGETSKCEMIVAWLKYSNLFRPSIVVKKATTLQTGPIELLSDFFHSASCWATFQKGTFFGTRMAAFQ